MTWTWDLSDGVLTVYDHTGGEVHSQDRANMDRGHRPLHDTLDVMYDEAVAEFQDAGGVNDRVLRILADAAFEQIEEVES